MRVVWRPWLWPERKRGCALNGCVAFFRSPVASPRFCTTKGVVFSHSCESSRDSAWCSASSEIACFDFCFVATISPIAPPPPPFELLHVRRPPFFAFFLQQVVNHLYVHLYAHRLLFFRRFFYHPSCLLFLLILFLSALPIISAVTTHLSPFILVATVAATRLVSPVPTVSTSFSTHALPATVHSISLPMSSDILVSAFASSVPVSPMASSSAPACFASVPVSTASIAGRQSCQHAQSQFINLQRQSQWVLSFLLGSA